MRIKVLLLLPAFLSWQCSNPGSSVDSASADGGTPSVVKTPNAIKQPSANAPVLTNSGVEVIISDTFIIENPISPTNDASPLASWTRTANTKHYDIMVSLESKCLSPVKSWAKYNDNSLEIDGLVDGTYYLCVQAILNDGKGLEWAQNNPLPFTIDTTAPVPGMINAMASITKDPTPTISWTAGVGENVYDLVISSESSCTTKVFEASVTELTATVTTELPESDYFVCLYYRDEAGNRVQAANSGLTFFRVLMAPEITISSALSANTNVSPIPVIVTFTNTVTGFTVGDLTIANGTASNFAGSGANYTFDLTPTAVGNVTVDIAANVAIDEVDVGNYEAPRFTINYNNIAPNVVLSSANAANTNAAPIVVDVTFSKSVTGLAANDFVIGNGTATSLSGSGSNYVLNVTPTADGNITIDLPTNKANDIHSNGNTAASQLLRNYDGTAPTVSISSPSPANINSSPFTVNVAFSEAVTGFALGDVTIGNGSAANFSGSGINYSFDVTPSAEGNVSVNIAANIAMDSHGNGNLAASQLTKNYNITSPTIVISSTAPALTNTSPIPVTITFSEAVSGFVVGDITVGNGSAADFSGSGAVYTVNVTPAAEGNVTIDIAANSAQDPHGNNSSAASQLVRNYNITAPTVTLSSAAAANTNSSPIAVTLTFSEDITGLNAGDLTIGNGTASNLSGSGASYSVDITPSAEGNVTVDLAANKVIDAHGNNNPAATQLVRNYNITAPTVSLASIAPAVTNMSPFPVTISFSEVVTGFAVGDISVTNATLANFAGSGTSYAVDVIPDAAGAVTVDISANVAIDAHGNGNTVATQLSREYNNSNPTATLTSTAPMNTNTSPIVVAVTFSDDVSGLALGDFTIGNGTAGNLTGSGSVYTIDVTPATNGTVTVDLPANIAVDGFGNNNLAAVQLTRNYSATSLTVALSSAAPSNTNQSPIPVTITFSSDVTGFDVSDISVGNGSAGNFAGTGAVYTVDITPTAEGNVTVDIPQTIAQDAFANDNAAATQLVRNYNITPPTLTLSSAAPANTNTSPIPLTITFSKAVTGFVVGDLSVGNGSASGFAGSGTTYTVNITPAAEGNVTIDVASSVAIDSHGNNNSAATQLVRNYNTTAPTVSFSSTAPANTNVSPIPVTITFSKAVTGFVVGDLSVGNGTAGNFSGSGASYSVDITPSAEGDVTLDVAANVAADAHGNGNSIATQLVRNYNITQPTVSLSSTAPSDTNTSPIPVVVTFSKSVSGLTLGDFTIGNGSAANLSGSGASYSVDVIPTANGTVSVDVNANVVIDSHGNSNTAATQLSRNYDTTPPTVSNVNSSTTNGHYTIGAGISIQVNFSETVTLVNGSPLLALNTTPTSRNATYVSGSGSSTVNLSYSVLATDTAADLNYSSTSALTANLRDNAGNTATLTLPALAGGSSLAGQKNLIIDTTPPGAATTLAVGRWNGRLDLSWVSGGGELGFIVVRRSGTAVTFTPTAGVNYPVGAIDGNHSVVYNGSNLVYSDTGLTNGTTYHYSVFAYDTARNHAAAVSTSAVPYPALLKQIITYQDQLLLSANASLVLTINPKIDLSKSLLMFSYSNASDRVERVGVTGQLSEDATNTYVTFARYSTGIDVAIQAKVIEFKDGVVVQRGAKTVNTASSHNITLATAVDSSRSLPIIGYRGAGGGGTFNFEESWLPTFTDSTTLNIVADSYNTTAGIVEWQVIEFHADAATVQTGAANFGAADTSNSATVASYDASKSLLIHYSRSPLATLNVARTMTKGVKTNATSVTISRNTSGNAQVNQFYLLSFANGTSVQSGEVSAWGTASTTAAISSVTNARAIASCGFGAFNMNCGTTTSTGKSLAPVAVELDLGAGPTTTTLTLTRTNTTSSSIVWNVIEFAN